MEKDEIKWVEAYVIRDPINGTWKRSGKNFPTPMNVRVLVQHLKDAQNENGGWTLKYPTKNCKNIIHALREGWFENFLEFCALEFMEGNTTALLDSSEKGIFDWDEKNIGSH